MQFVKSAVLIFLSMTRVALLSVTNERLTNIRQSHELFLGVKINKFMLKIHFSLLQKVFSIKMLLQSTYYLVIFNLKSHQNARKQQRLCFL